MRDVVNISRRLSAVYLQTKTERFDVVNEHEYLEKHECTPEGKHHMISFDGHQQCIFI